MLKRNLLILFSAFYFLAPNAYARVEYALQSRITSCTACHVSPFGGGLRNVDGKLYGSRFDFPSELSKQDLWSVDARMIAYYPKGGTTSRQGTAIMETSVGANVPIQKFQDGSELRAVGVYSLGVVLQGPRELFGLWQSGPSEKSPFYVQVGRFNAPFGLSTDEHRTYTKLLTRTEIFDYEAGGALSGDLSGGLHFDFAITNGLDTGGQFNSGSTTAAESTSAAFLNARWMPSFLPLLIGISGETQNRLSPNQSPYAVALYSAISLDRLTDNWMSGSLLLEGVYAEHWCDPTINPNINRYFIPQNDSDYLNTVSGRPAEAWYAQLNLNIFKRWVAQYKFDMVNFDPNFQGDRFLRHGMGFKYFAGSNVILMSRYEFANVGRAEIKGSGVYADSDAFWAILQLWL